MAMASKPNFHFVLVHGICHGAWCWYKMVHLLQQDGHRVTAINLKSAGTDPSLVDEIKSFEDYNQPLMDFLAQLPSSDKIVLVGHSFGGVSLAYASEVFPEKIAVAVYVAGIMILGGDRLQEDFKLLQQEEEIENQFIYNFGDGPEQPPTSLAFPTILQKYLFYQTSPSADAILASLCLRPVPHKSIVNNGLRTSDEKYGRVPRVYIKTEKDNIIKPETQEAFIKGNPPKEVHSLNCDHSPFFSLPDELHHLLSDIVTKFNTTSL